MPSPSTKTKRSRFRAGGADAERLIGEFGALPVFPENSPAATGLEKQIRAKIGSLLILGGNHAAVTEKVSALNQQVAEVLSAWSKLVPTKSPKRRCVFRLKRSKAIRS